MTGSWRFICFSSTDEFYGIDKRAMTISTGAIDPMELATLFTLVEGNATDFGATAMMASMTLRCT